MGTVVYAQSFVLPPYHFLRSVELPICPRCLSREKQTDKCNLSSNHFWPWGRIDTSRELFTLGNYLPLLILIIQIVKSIPPGGYVLQKLSWRKRKPDSDY